MTNEESVIKQAEDILQEAIEQRQNAQIKEHQQMMPYLSNYATEIIAQKGDDAAGIHLFVIQEAKQGDKDKADNPLGLTSNDTSVGDFSPWYTFTDTADAIACLSQPTSAILFNELDKQRTNPLNSKAVYLKVNDKLQMLYCAGNLTVYKMAPNGEPMTKTARIRHEEPEEFFDIINLNTEHKQLCGAIVTMCEAGKLMEKQMPDTYNLMLKRIEKEFGDDQ